MYKAGSLIAPIIKKLGIEDSVRLTQIKNDWHKMFDRTLSLHMSPSQLSEGELLLNVDSPMWLQQLNYYKREILKKLSTYDIRDVRFRIGRVSQKKRLEPHEERLKELSPEDARFIAELVSGLGDDGLKNAVRVAAEKALKAENPKER